MRWNFLNHKQNIMIIILYRMIRTSSFWKISSGSRISQKGGTNLLFGQMSHSYSFACIFRQKLDPSMKIFNTWPIMSKQGVHENRKMRQEERQNVLGETGLWNASQEIRWNDETTVGGGPRPWLFIRFFTSDFLM